MKIICAPDSFKESLTAANAALAMKRGAERAAAASGVKLDVDLCPVADGGEGTAQTLVEATGGRMLQTLVTGPLGDTVSAAWGLLGDDTTAVIEVAEACGLHLIPVEQRNPEKTTTYGVGELMTAALDHGCSTFIVGLGGSSTTDGGAGLAAALGARFVGASMHVTGGELLQITAVDLDSLDSRLRGSTIRVACDVNNPLCGARGSAAVYGPQKGATPEQVERLDRGLAHLAQMLDADPNTPGFGSAGGLGFGLSVLLGGVLEPGAAMVLDVLGFERRCANADLVLTGEGRLDEQSASGKAALTVARLAAAQNIPTIALVGSASNDADRCCDPARGGYLTAWRSISGGPISVAESFERAETLLESLAERVTHEWLAADQETHV